MLFFVYRKGVLLPAFAGRQAVRRIPLSSPERKNIGMTRVPKNL
jgi:hypothetical protein